MHPAGNVLKVVSIILKASMGTPMQHGQNVDSNCIKQTGNVVYLYFAFESLLFTKASRHTENTGFCR